MQFPKHFDVIVVGGGHAGVEAALASARRGAQTLLLTQNIETLGQMSCNPAIGGIGKGHLVREIDALGGIMGVAADQAGIQYRTLNASKGAAVRATRAQADRMLYKAAVRYAVEQQPNLVLFQQAAADLILTGERVTGIRTQFGLRFAAEAVILTSGTFLAGVIHVGLTHSPGGRAGDPASEQLAARLRELPLRVGRLKTGTPPRIDGRTVDFSAMQSQPGDQPTRAFSYLGPPTQRPRQVNCYITRTSEQTHEIIRAGLDRSPLYSGHIAGRGPRYCPSIEDKVVRFAERSSHQIFVEPEGLNTTELYPNGISTSLPFDVQLAFVRTIHGFENAHITRPGYAIEYDFFDPRDLHPWLETKPIEGLFFGGQINGTTGYEEAAAQGLLAGINAAGKALGRELWWPRRDEAYLGVLIDDLITRGADEPYRMFTSRAEYRLSLREDNADQRLTESGRRLGLVDEQRWRRYNEKRAAIEQLHGLLENQLVHPGTDVAEQINPFLTSPLLREVRLTELLRRPEVRITDLTAPWPEQFGGFSPEVLEQTEIQFKYSGYIDRQTQEIHRSMRYETLRLPHGLNYGKISGLSTEVREKLSRQQPDTLGQAARIPGITPAAISLLLVHLKKQQIA